MTRPAAWLWLLAAVPALAPANDNAPLRDPMQPPARRAAAVAAPAAASAPLPVVRQILVIGDNRYVVDQGRLRRVGESIGGLRIERIEDAAVVVRDGTTLRRLPLFAGVAKRAPTPEAAPAASPVPPAAASPAALAAR